MSINRYRIASATPFILVSTLALTACAGKQVWNPELEDARNTFQQISEDRIVTSLAAKEMKEAQMQLQKAETASDQFRAQEVVAHEARLAKIRSQVAQQQARALSANHNLQLAMGQQPLLNEELVAAASPEQQANPVMAAATPAFEAGDQSVAAQLAALSAQIASLQAQLQNQAPAAQTQSATPAAALIDNPAPAAVQGNGMQAEPKFAAALPQQDIQLETQSLPSADRLQQELRAINAQASSRGMSLTLGERYFAQGSARLWSGRAARHLDNVASILSENPSLQLDIEAHTDNKSTTENNFELSVNRAVSIKSALVLRGIKENQLNAVGYGDSRPLAENNSPLGRLQNRRVELVFSNVPVASL